MHRLSLIAVFALAPVPSQTPPALGDIDSFVDQHRKEWRVPGIALVVVQDGKVIHSKGYGLRNVKDNLLVTPKTLFAVGSTTKAMTAALLATLADDGKLDWDKPVRDYLPDFRMHDTVATERMTPRDLVTHRSGLPRHDLIWYASPFSRQQIYDRIRYLEPTKDLRSTFQYQNVMYMTAGYLAGRILDTSWEQALRARLFEPMGMQASNFSVNDSRKSSDHALPYSKRNEEAVEVPFRNIDAIGPAGSVNSNIEDMARWVLLNLSEGKAQGKQVVSAAQVSRMHTPQIAVAGDSPHAELGPSSYGLGWMITTYRGHKLVSHGGGIDGFTSLVSFMPKSKIGMVILTNLGGTSLPGLISYSVYDRLLGLEPVPWAARLREEQAKAAKSREEAAKKSYSARRPGTRPSHDFADYAGSYEHPAFGAMKVEVKQGKLHARLHGLSTALEHFHYDVFAAPENPDSPISRLKFQFGSNLDGIVDTVAVPFEAALKPALFHRVAGDAMRKKEFLEPLAGQYTLGPMTATVALQAGDTLTLTVPGQPRYDLVPLQDLRFTLKGLTGFSVEFKRNAAGAVEEAVFHQPNGTFVAKRKP